jgi:uncharacterized protein YegP (UPF0339 family)
MSKYEIFQSETDGSWRWRLKARNGEILAQSEGYTRKEDAERGLTDAKEASAEADLVEPE